MNQMNMQGVNPGIAGPIGGIPMMNNGSAPRSEPNNGIHDATITQLNTYIYDYFLKRGYHDCARALYQDENVPMNTTQTPKSHPNRRESEMNGVDGDSMTGDSKEDVKTRIPDDLPRPYLNGETQQTSFLFDWFCLFWDIFWAQRKKQRSNDAMQYIQHTQNMLRLREQQQTQLLRNSQMIPNQFNMRGVRPGMMPANLQKSVLQTNPQNMTPQQMAHLRSQQAQLMQNHMQREHSDIEMNGHRAQSPSSVENAPSPSKRPRLDGTQINGQQMNPNGRGQGQGIPGQPAQQANALLMQHGINPGSLTAAQLRSLQSQNPAVQAKSVQVYNHNLAMHHTRSAMNNQGVPNGLMNPGVMPNQGEIMPSMPDAQGLIPGQEYYANGQMAQMRPGMQTPGGQNGNHALQDYQMQLMLLEQQNKKRLLMAKQEQDGVPRADGQPAVPGQPNLPPGTSPQGSRAGASPNPNDQMKRGTPKMPQTGLPGSPNVGDAMAQGRGSPASMNFAGQMAQDMGGAAFFNVKNMQDGVMGPNGMRHPPSSNPSFSGPQMTQSMDAISRQQPVGAGSRMPSGNWQQTPQGPPMMAQQQAPGQGQAPGTSQERSAMPPPQAPPSTAASNTTRASPQPGSIAPPTPQQANKPAPKGKREGKEGARKRPQKKMTAPNATNTTATPSSEAEPPPTPTPSTPITPVHPNSFKAATTTAGTGSQPTSAPAPQSIGQQQAVPQPPQQQTQQPPQQPQPPQQDPTQTYGDLDNNTFSLDFSSLENPDLLENFDFDTFLNTDDPTSFGFEANLGYTGDGVEAGTGEGL